MMLADFFTQVTASWLSIGSYTAMGLILIETLGETRSAGRALRASRGLEHQIGKMRRNSVHAISGVDVDAPSGQQLGEYGLPTLCAQADRFRSHDLRRAWYRLHYWELVAPAAGLGMTMLSFVSALPGAREALLTEPDILFSKVGAGGGTSVIGVLCFIIALSQKLRLELATERLSEATKSKGDRL